MINAFSVDLEDWFCVRNFSDVIHIDQWGTHESRIEKNTYQLLELFERFHIKVTFFVLGWIADHHPDLIRTIARAGHEIGSHGYGHLMVKNVTPEDFQLDIEKSLHAIHKLIDTPVRGFRAPSFSIDPQKKWIFDILIKQGIRYDSSVFPLAFHPDYAALGSPLSIYEISPGLYEFPMSCFRIGPLVLPCSGGAYFRFFPYSYTAFGIRRCNKDKRPAIFYLHPWEIDPGQPRVNGISSVKRLRHYSNLDKTFSRLERLLDEFEFSPVMSVLGYK